MWSRSVVAVASILAMGAGNGLAQSAMPLGPQSDTTISPACWKPWRLRPLAPQRTGSGDSAIRAFQASATRMRGDLFIAANSWSIGNGRDARTVLRTAQGDTIAVPDGARDGIFPEVLAIGDTLHLIWGASDPRGGGDSIPPWVRDVTSVWTASRLSTGEWTVPRQLVSALSVDWNPALRSAVTRSPDGTPHLIFLAMHSTGRRGFFDVRFRGPLPDVDTLDFGGSSVTVAWRDTLGLLAFISVDRSAIEDHNSVFASRWDWRGNRWRPPQLVSFSGTTGGATAPGAAITADGTIHLVWAQSRTPGSLQPEALMHVSSANGGMTWSTRDYMLIPAVPLALLDVGPSAVAAPFLQWDANGSTRLMVACWSERWRSPRQVVEGTRVYDVRRVNGSSTELIIRDSPSSPVARLSVLTIPW